MVGELSPDGKFVWNGTVWEAIPDTKQQPTAENIFQLNSQTDDGVVDWNPVPEKSEEGGKGKIIAMSIVGLLLVSAMGWVLYAFVIMECYFQTNFQKMNS